MKLSYSFIGLACAAVLFSACKVQNAPGAYLPAEGKQAEKEVLVQKPKEEPKVEPVAQDTAKPVVVEQPVVEEKPAPVEKEVTRAEVFSVAEGESDADLKSYNVVIGSFKSQENAKRLQERMRPEYKPIIIINEQGMYRVLLASYDDYASAKQKIASIRSQFADAWVLVQKK